MTEIETMRFNLRDTLVGAQGRDPNGEEIKMTPSLWNASYDDACRFGGPVTREALASLELRGDRDFVTVDSKIHMLMTGMIPSIPGWHTDGVPRSSTGDPSASGPPMLGLQQRLDAEGEAPRFHLFTTGTHCPTEFFAVRQFEIERTGATYTSDLYADMTRQVNKYTSEYRDYDRYFTQPAQWVEWDWWNIHRATAAASSGWRLLIRVTESNHLRPQTDIRKVIRLHNPVYLTSEFGW